MKRAAKETETVRDEQQQAGVIPPAQRPWLLGALALVLATSIAAIFVRGPAILLDLQSLSAMIWCF